MFEKVNNYMNINTDKYLFHNIYKNDTNIYLLVKHNF